MLTDDSRISLRAVLAGSPNRGGLLLFLLLALLALPGHQCGGGNVAPTAPIVTLTNSLSNSASGNISPCQDDGLPSGSTCTLQVFAVASGAAPTAPPIAGPVTPSGGTWMLSGIPGGEGRAYTIYGTASDGAITTPSAAVPATTNSRPSAPTISIPSANVVPGGVSGTLSACVDDGQPGQCLQDVRAVFNPQVTTPPGYAGSCTNTASGCQCTNVRQIAPVSSGSFTMTGLGANVPYKFYGVNDDMEFDVCSAPLERTMVDSQSGCWKWSAGLFFTIPNGLIQNPNIMNSVRADWQTRDVNAPDLTSLGASLVAIQVPTGNMAAPVADATGMIPFDPLKLNSGGTFVEVGHMEGTVPTGPTTGTQGKVYFAFQLRSNGMFEIRRFVNTSGQTLAWTPPGATQTFYAGSCYTTLNNGPICNGEPPTTAYACVQNSNCLKFTNHGATSGTKWFAIALESTCGSDATSFIRKQHIDEIQVREGANWRNFNSLPGATDPFRGLTANRLTTPHNPGAGPDFDLRLCVPGNRDQVIGWMHDNQTNPSCL